MDEDSLDFTLVFFAFIKNQIIKYVIRVIALTCPKRKLYLNI